MFLITAMFTTPLPALLISTAVLAIGGGAYVIVSMPLAVTRSHYIPRDNGKLTISECYCYPVKSCLGVKMDKLIVEKDGGVRMDRSYVIVRPGASENTLVTGRMIPKVGGIATSFDDEGNVFLRLPGGKTSTVLQPKSGRRIEFELWRTQVGGIDCGNSVATFLSDYLGKEVRLLFMKEAERQLVSDPKYRDAGVGEEDTARFSDWSSLSVCR